MTLLFTVCTGKIRMNELEKARNEIEKADKELAGLFEHRMEMSAVIGEYKAKNGLPVRDEKRECELTEKNSAYVENGDIKPYYAEFLRKVIELSCEYQQKIINGKKDCGGS